MSLERYVFYSEIVWLLIGVINAVLHGGYTYESEFHTFVKTYEKSYHNDTNEYHKRMEIFQENYEISVKFNSSRPDNHSAWFGVNKFSDLSSKEFKDIYLSDYIPTTLAPFKRPLMSSQDGLLLPGKLPKRVDWREKGHVTKVKNQGACGGCWAFSSIELIESQYAAQSGKLRELSIQEVLDCSRTTNTPYGKLQGCKGGQLCAALYWLNETRTTIVNESKYKFRDSDHYCKVIPQADPGITVQDYECYTYIHHEIEILRYLSSHGPVSVAVDASNWHNYLGGIVQYHCSTDLNHAVQIVGYDMSGPVPYYIVRNSWGTDWGLKGYIHVRYNKNMCGIASEVTMVTKINVV